MKLTRKSNSETWSRYKLETQGLSCRASDLSTLMAAVESHPLISPRHLKYYFFFVKHIGTLGTFNIYILRLNSTKLTTYSRCSSVGITTGY